MDLYPADKFGALSIILLRYANACWAYCTFHL